MVKGELKNINKLEQEERVTALNPNDFLFNVSSEQVKVLIDFNQSGFINTSRIIIRGPGSL